MQNLICILLPARPGIDEKIMIGLIDKIAARGPKEHLPIFNYEILHNRKGKGTQRTHIDLLRTTTAHGGLYMYI